MESMKDFWLLMALDLELQGLLNLCQTSKEFNEKICNSQQFWARRISKEYPHIDISDVKDYKGLYRYLKNRLIVDNVYKQGHALVKDGETVIVSLSGDRIVYERPWDVELAGYRFPRFSPEYFNSIGNNYIPVSGMVLQEYLKTGYIKGEFGEKYKVNINERIDIKDVREIFGDVGSTLLKFKNGQFYYD